jgi:hypothetical protein
MRSKRVVVVTVLAFVVAVAGCTPPRAAETVNRVTVSPAARRHAPAPAEPDLATVMERFYQQIEGAHWPFAYAMLSPRYRATMSQDRFVALYERFTDLDVSLRQDGDRTVVATLRAKERGEMAHGRRFEETTTLAWDGEDWKIERIARRDSR